MANASKIRRSSVPGKIPSTDDIGPGDIGVNSYDGKIYVRKDVGGTPTVVAVGSDGSVSTESPSFTGVPTAPTPALESDSEQIATTAFVKDVVLDYAPSKTGAGATGLWDISIAGNAATASVLAGSPRINGVVFNGSSDITLPASSSAALTAGSFLVSDGAYDGSTPRTFSVDASSGNSSNKLVARDALGNFSAGTITATLNGTALQAQTALTSVTSTSAARITDANGNVVIDTTFIGGSSNDIDIRPVSGAIRLWNNTSSNHWSIVRPTISSNRTLTLADGNTVLVAGTMLTSGTASIVNADISATAAIEDTKLATIATAGKVSNSATTAASANTPSAIVARDASGNFAAGTITAALTGTASGNLPLSGGTLTGVLQTVAGSAAAPAVAIGEATTGLFRISAGILGITTNGTEAARVDANNRWGFNYTGTLGGTNGVYRFHGTISGNATSYGLNLTSEIGNDATTTAAAYRSVPSTVDGISGLANLRHFQADQGTITGGTRGAVVDQIGFFANALINATRNYGFYGNIDTAAGRWNFYAAGTAANYVAGDFRSDGVVSQRIVTTVQNNSSTATATSLRNGMRIGTPTTNITLTMPTGTDLEAVFQELQTNQGFQWSVINLAAATFTITLVESTGHTLTGNLVVAASTSGRFMTRKTAANTFVTYRIS